MSRRQVLWAMVIATLAVIVAVQVTSTSQSHSGVIAQAELPTVAPGADVLAGVATAPGGRNGCDTRNDILDRDLRRKTYVSISRCPTAVATGTLHDPYTSGVVPFTRGNQTGAAVQIDHVVSVILTDRADIYTGQAVDYMPLTVADVVPVRAVV